MSIPIGGISIGIDICPILSRYWFMLNANLKLFFFPKKNLKLCSVDHKMFIKLELKCFHSLM